MSAGWEVGDLAVKVGGSWPGMWTVPEVSAKRGTIRKVDGVVCRDGWTALVFNDHPSPHFTRGWHANGWRKITPDAHEDCEPEFVTLLNRIKRPVSA